MPKSHGHGRHSRQIHWKDEVTLHSLRCIIIIISHWKCHMQIIFILNLFCVTLIRLLHFMVKRQIPTYHTCTS